MNKIIFYLKFGFKNLWRRKRRTFVLGISLFIVALLVVLGISYSLGIYHQFISSAKQNFLGEYMIFHNSTKQDILWPEEIVSFDVSEIKSWMEKKNITYWMQYRAKGFCYNDKYESFVLVKGVDIRYKEKIKIIDGNLLNWFGENQVLITKELAENLKVGIGDEIIIEVVNKDGVRNFEYFQVVGLYKIYGISSVFGGHMLLMDIHQLRRLMMEKDDTVTEVVIEKINDSNSLNELIASYTDLTIQKWNKYGSLLVSIVKINVAMTFIIIGILFLIVLVFIVDNLFILIEERKKEFAYMMAVGLGSKEIIGMMWSEVLSLLICFGLPAFAIGGLCSLFLSYVGIPISSQAVGAILGGYERLFFRIDLISYILVFLIMNFVVSVTIIFPIRRILSWKVIEILRG